MFRLRMWLAWLTLPKCVPGYLLFGAQCFTRAFDITGKDCGVWAVPDGRQFIVREIADPVEADGLPTVRCNICTNEFEYKPGTAWKCLSCGSSDCSPVQE